MKTLKKLSALVVAVIMMFAMTVTAFASYPNPVVETYSITINNTTVGHTYSVYQVFYGDISGTEPNYVLSNVKYGVNYAGKTAGELVPESELNAITDADAFAKTVTLTEATYIDPVASTAGSTVIDGLEPGYYVIKETANSTADEGWTKAIVQVVGDATVTVKSDKPSSEKKVMENVKPVNGTTDSRIPDYEVGSQYNDVADYNIGDAVPFELIGTLPQNYADYTKYYYNFHDTWSAGFDAPQNVKVYLSADGTETDITAYFVTTIDGSSMTVCCSDLKAVAAAKAGDKIVVRYTAVLNANAEIGTPGNINTSYLEYSRQPGSDSDGDHGKTTEDKVVVFTYELDVNKVDGKDEAVKLEGAEFKLHAGDKWLIVDENNKVAGWGTEEEASVLTSDADGHFAVIGLDDGTYFLKETKAPVGYNLLTNEIELNIVATTVNNQTWDGQSAEAALTALNLKDNAGEILNVGDISTGTVTATIANNKGATLPTTGGIGTTIFYVLGSILVLAAAVLLIAKRRVVRY